MTEADLLTIFGREDQTRTAKGQLAGLRAVALAAWKSGFDSGHYHEGEEYDCDCKRDLFSLFEASMHEGTGEKDG